MFHVKLWIPLLGAVPLAVAAAGFQGPGPVPGGSSEDQEVRVPIGGTAVETSKAGSSWLDAGKVVERWQALGGFFDPAAKAAFRGSASPAESDYVTDVGARLILPGREALKEIPRKRVDYYLQFDGPLSAVERREYVLEGVRFCSAMRGHTYVVRLDRRAFRLLQDDPRLRGLEPVYPADKLTRGLYEGRVHPEAMHRDGTMDAYVRFYSDVRHDHALAVLERWGVTVTDGDAYFAQRLGVRLTHGQALVLAEEPAVLSLAEVEEPVMERNHFASLMSNVNNVHDAPYNLTGAGVRVGVWEIDSPVDTHEQFSGRLTLEQDTGAGDHATHVTCTIMGDGTGDAMAMGMAPGLERAYAYTAAGDVPREMVGAIEDHGIVAANCSFGTITGWEDGDDGGNHYRFGRYDTLAGLYDHVVLGKRLLLQVAAGNDGNDCNAAGTECDGVLGDDGIRYHTIPEEANAKNIITVGSVNSSRDLAEFSSCGPTDDTRIKPDLVAKGNQLWSAWANGVTEGDCPGVYCHMDGTSTSTPVVTGTVALLVEQYRQVYGGANPRAETLKAVLINGAEDLGRYGPDFAYGHGLLDAEAAAETIAIGPVRIINDFVTEGETRSYFLEVPAGMPQLRVTGVWTDIPGRPVSDDPDLVHDLDLRLIAPDSSVHFPFSGPTASDTGETTNTERNSRDNVEVVYVENPASGIWVVEMRGASIPIGPQPYAIVSNTSFFSEDEPNIEVGTNLVFDENCIGSTPGERSVTIYNTGGAPLAVHSVEVTEGAPDFSLVPLPSPPFLIQPGGQVELIVLFEPQTEGLLTGNLQITSNDLENGVIDLPMEGLGGSPTMELILEGSFFGRVALGDTESREVLITNNSTCPMEVLNVENVFGSSDYDLGGIYDFPVIVYPGEQLSFFIAYTPTVYGETWANINIEATAAPFGFGFTCGGSCPAPVITTAGSLDFGEACGGDLLEKQLDICNTGFSDLEVTSVDFATGCEDFTLVNNPFPATLTAGACLVVTVSYEPTDLGEHECELEIESNDPLNPLVSVSATGSNEPPNIWFSGPVDFGMVCAGALSEQELLICNTGHCDLEVYSLEFDPPCGDFQIINNPFPATVGTDTCLPVTIRYTPSGSGDHACILVITSNDPDQPVIELGVFGSTPETVLDIPPDVAFPPTVIQDVAACASYAPFPVTNLGECPVTITGFEIVQAGADYSVDLLPTLPIVLQPGEVLGEDDLALVFAPLDVARHSDAEVRVTYVTNLPGVGDTETLTRRLCGESTRTGVRVLVTEDDLPVAEVKHVNFYRVYYPGTVDEALSIITLENDRPLMTVDEDSPCAGFQYHREWGAVTDPMILAPATYRVNVKIINAAGYLQTKIVQFELDYCEFWHDLRIDY